MFLRYHQLSGLINKDVSSVLETPKTWRRLPSALNEKRTVELIEAVDVESPFYQRDRALLELLYATGMRASEAADQEALKAEF